MTAPDRAAVAGYWDQNLGYGHAFVTVVMALTLGLAFHVWVGYRLVALAPPAAVGGVALAPLLAMAVLARTHPGNRLVKWLTGVPFAMVSAGAFGVMALAGGIFPESSIQRLGVESVWASWPFILVGWLMMVNLVGSCGRRAWPLTYTNVVYLCSHLGLAVALIGGVASALTLDRRTMVLFPGVPSERAYDRQDHESDAPFPVTLREFRMDTFAPTLTFATVDERSPDGIRQTPGQQLLKTGLVETIGGVRVEVLEVLPKAVHDGVRWRAVEWKGAPPAARIRATPADGQPREGWVSCGGGTTMGAYLGVGEEAAILMNQPRPKKFESAIEVDGRPAVVGVNAPVEHDGFHIYQLSYDEKAGAASAYSVVEIVRDPGLPIVYLGIYVMLFGAGLHLWNGVKK